MGKSPAQYKLWLAKWTLAVNNFVMVCGPRNIHEITRDDARAFYNWWRDKIAPDRKSGKTATHTASGGNRQIGILRKLYRRYFLYMGAGEGDIKNPFDNLSFAEKKRSSDEKLRLSFATEWIVKRILAIGALEGLNDEARAIVLTLIETGCRPSEVANLEPEHIMLSAPIPYIKIRPNLDPDRPREIKTASSVRDIPLLGVSLEAMRKFPEGFPRYKDKGNSLSATLNKYFRENGLFPTEKHVIYSFRHSFEDRMKHVKADVEMRKILMGHGLDRPQYGDGGLEWKRAELARMALPFDPAIV
jgi:integrase